METQAMRKTIFPGAPRIKSLVFAIDALADLSIDQQAIAHSESQQGYAVIDLPDPHVGEQIARIKANLSPLFHKSSDDPATSRRSGTRRVHASLQHDEDVRSVRLTLEDLPARADPIFYALGSPPGQLSATP